MPASKQDSSTSASPQASPAPVRRSLGSGSRIRVSAGRGASAGAVRLQACGDARSSGCKLGGGAVDEADGVGDSISSGGGSAAPTALCRRAPLGDGVVRSATAKSASASMGSACWCFAAGARGGRAGGRAGSAGQGESSRSPWASRCWSFRRSSSLRALLSRIWSTRRCEAERPSGSRFVDVWLPLPPPAERSPSKWELRPLSTAEVDAADGPNSAVCGERSRSSDLLFSARMRARRALLVALLLELPSALATSTASATSGVAATVGSPRGAAESRPVECTSAASGAMRAFLALALRADASLAAAGADSGLCCIWRLLGSSLRARAARLARIACIRACRSLGSPGGPSGAGFASSATFGGDSQVMGPVPVMSTSSESPTGSRFVISGAASTPSRAPRLSFSFAKQARRSAAVPVMAPVAR